MMNDDPESSMGLRLSPLAAGQLSYHLRMAAAFAAAGQIEESASESVIAWAVLHTCWPQASSAASEVATELIDPEMVVATEQQRERAQARARDQAMSLQSHFVSVGFHEHASLYQAVATQLDSTDVGLAKPST